MKLVLKTWIDKRINDIDYFDYNVFSNIEEIDEGTVGTFKKAKLVKFTAAIKNLSNPILEEDDFNEFIRKVITLIIFVRKYNKSKC